MYTHQLQSALVPVLFPPLLSSSSPLPPLISSYLILPDLIHRFSSSHPFSIPLPLVPTQDAISLKTDGWLYASGFRGHFSLEKRKRHTVRSRRLRRERVLDPEADVAELPPLTEEEVRAGWRRRGRRFDSC